MNRNPQYVDSLEGFSIGTVVGAQLEPTLERDIPQGDPRLSNPFESFEEIYPMAPVKIYVVTDEMRQRDAAERRDREAKRIAAQAWKPPVSRTLNGIAPKPSYVLPTGRRVNQRIIRSIRMCDGGCGEAVLPKSKSGLCRQCYRFRGSAKPAEPLRFCVAGCGAKVTAKSTSGKCRSCALRANPLRNSYKRRITAVQA